MFFNPNVVLNKKSLKQNPIETNADFTDAPIERNMFDQVIAGEREAEDERVSASPFEQVVSDWTEDAIRNFTQLPLGYLKKYTWPLDVYKLWGAGESFAALEELEDRLPELKKKFPEMDWPESIDKEAYMRATGAALDLIPTQSNVEKFVEEKTGIPLEPKTGVQKKLRLAGEAAGFKGGGLLEKSIAGVLAPATAKGLEAFGVPEPYAEGIGLLLSQVDVSGMGKVVGAEAEALVKRAEQLGMTEREIAPLLQSPTKMGIFAKFSKKGVKTEQLIKDIQEMLGNGYAQLSQTPEALVKFSYKKGKKVVETINKALKKLPVSARKKIAPDLKELGKGELTGSKLINFYQDVNYHMKQGEHGLVVLKEPIRKALNDISPGLASDFDLTNNLYARFAGVREKLTPGMVDSFITSAELLGGAGAFLKGVMTGNFSELAGVVGIDVARRLARELITNPKLYNLPRKLLSATGPTAKSVLGHIADEIEKFDGDLSELASEIREFDVDNLHKE